MCMSSRSASASVSSLFAGPRSPGSRASEQEGELAPRAQGPHAELVGQGDRPAQMLLAEPRLGTTRPRPALPEQPQRVRLVAALLSSHGEVERLAGQLAGLRRLAGEQRYRAEMRDEQGEPAQRSEAARTLDIVLDQAPTLVHASGVGLGQPEIHGEGREEEGRARSPRARG
jgi:hypothetical protein